MWRPGARVRPSAMICPSAAPREANAGPHEPKTEPHENSRAVPKRRTFSFLRQ